MSLYTISATYSDQRASWTGYVIKDSSSIPVSVSWGHKSYREALRAAEAARAQIEARAAPTAHAQPTPRFVRETPRARRPW